MDYLHLLYLLERSASAASHPPQRSTKDPHYVHRLTNWILYKTKVCVALAAVHEIGYSCTLPRFSILRGHFLFNRLIRAPWKTIYGSNPFCPLSHVPFARSVFSILLCKMASSPFPLGVDLSKIPYQMPPLGVISNFANPVTLSDVIIAVSTVTLFLAFIFLCMRLYSTMRITRSIGSDDYLTLQSLPSFSV